MELRIASVARIPLIGDQHSVTTSWMLVDLQQEGARWMQRHQVCDVRVHGDAGGARLIVPPVFLRSLPARVYPVSLTARNDRGSYSADMGVELIGLERSYSEASLPRNARRPGVRDTDGDGAPGATIEMQIPALGRVKLYVVQRSHLVLNGHRAPDGSVRVRLTSTYRSSGRSAPGPDCWGARPPSALSRHAAISRWCEFPGPPVAPSSERYGKRSFPMADPGVFRWRK